jgi:hypothetical protein
MNFTLRNMGRIEERIEAAKELFSIRDRILDTEIAFYLEKLNLAIEESRKLMEKVGVTEACAECKDASCCGRGIEERYDSITLLINLLLGNELSEGDADGCYFLTSNGCSLKVREVICVNYLCEKIYSSVEHEQLIFLQEAYGRELETLFLLSEMIKRRIRENL